MNMYVPPHLNRMGGLPEQTRRVMLVDDHEVFRVGLRNLLTEMASFEVVAEAGTCEAALAQVRSAPVDLVLLDLHLPDVEGVEALRRLKAETSPPDVIIVSATIDDDTLLDALASGVAGYITKDTTAIEILDALREYKRGELAMTSAVFSRAVRLLLVQSQMLENELTLYRQSALKTPAKVGTLEGNATIFPTQQSAHVPLGQLTPQEDKVYQLMQRGYSNKQIAAELFISRFTVGKHVQNILRKLGVTNRTQAVSYFLFEGNGE